MARYRTWCWTLQSCTESSSELHVSLAILLSASTFLCSASIGLSRVSMCAYKCPCLLTFLPVTASILQRWVAPGRWWSNDAWLMNVLAQTWPYERACGRWLSGVHLVSARPKRLPGVQLGSTEPRRLPSTSHQPPEALGHRLGR